jgi:serine/threonine-protein kinase
MVSERQTPPPLDPDHLRPIFATLAMIGVAAGAWSVFLWRQLLRARSGGDVFCGFGDDGDCVALWDGGFASAVHSLTGLPLAAWGVVWGLIACLLPLLAWGRSASPAAPSLRSATRVTALAGLVTVTVMLMVSVAAGSFCTSCAVVYVLAVAYAAVASLRLESPPTGRGAAIAAAAALVFYLALLYPGLKTPKSSGQALAEAVDRAASTGSSTGAATPALEAFLASLPPDYRQGISNLLYSYATSPVFPERTPRAIAIGPADAEVRITDFSDVLCSHCADLHRAFAYLEASLPPGSFRLDSRHFPLDGNCNPYIERQAESDVRCLAARAQICMEGAPAAFDFATELYEHQQQLTSARVLELARPFADVAELERCIASPETAARLREDVEYAWEYRPGGTPLVLINGRQGSAFDSFLYAVILAGGRPDHPAFASLPPPTFGG